MLYTSKRKGIDANVATHKSGEGAQSQRLNYTHGVALAVDMSQNNPIRLFITHAWDTSDDYLRVFEYLESARNFFYKNLSAPDKAPSGGKEADREELRRQMAQAECIIA